MSICNIFTVQWLHASLLTLAGVESGSFACYGAALPARSQLISEHLADGEATKGPTCDVHTKIISTSAELIIIMKDKIKEDISSLTSSWNFRERC